MFLKTFGYLLAVLGTVASGNARAATPGAKPHDMNTSQSAGRCLEEEPCRTSVSLPTKEGGREAERHRETAADHRAALALHDAEAKACGGIDDRDRDWGPFRRREDIEKLEPLWGTPWSRLSSSPGAASTTLVGAVMTLRAVPGLTAELLRRTIDCHLARNATLGHDVPKMAYCPLAPKGVTVLVSSAGSRFRVEIRAPDAETAREVWRRARALAPVS